MIFPSTHLMVNMVSLYLEDVLFGSLDIEIQGKTRFGVLMLLNFHW